MALLQSTPELGFAVVVMGVSGSGKSTIGSMLAEALSCEFLDADNFHTRSSIEKMASGEALSDEDRFPWLEKLRDVLGAHLVRGERVVLACSALRSSYRDILRGASERVVFLHLKASGFLLARVEARFREGRHYMPPSLLGSQMACLEMRVDEEDIIEVETETEPSLIVEEALSRIRERFSTVDHHMFLPEPNAKVRESQSE